VGASVDFKDGLIDLLDASKFGQMKYTPYQVYTKALFEYFKDELGEDALQLGRSAVALAEFQEDAVRKARRILSRYDGVLIADSVAWVRRGSARSSWRTSPTTGAEGGGRVLSLAAAHVAAGTGVGHHRRQIVGMEEMGRDTFDPKPLGDADVLLIDESHNFRNNKSNRYDAIERLIQLKAVRVGMVPQEVILLSATPSIRPV